MYEINARVKQVRKAQQPKMNQTEFGEILGVSRDVIANIEMNRVAQPTEQFMRLLCRTFGVSYIWLVEGKGEMCLDDSKTEAKFERIMSGENEFMKNVMRTALTVFDDDDWEDIRRLIAKITTGSR